MSLQNQFEENERTLEQPAAKSVAHLRADVWFRAPLIDGQFLGLPWAPALQFYAEAVFDAVTESLREWLAQGWRPDLDDIQKQLSAPAARRPPVEMLGEIPTVKVDVKFTKVY
jgi:hypothetical protein